MRTTLLIAATAAMTGCVTHTDPTEDCEEMTRGWVDEDKDGYGEGDPIMVCELGELVDNGIDCNDADPMVSPAAKELCNGIDDDCDGELDNGFERTVFFADTDNDGFGAPFPATASCATPAEGLWTNNSSDCDDNNPAINPGAIEVCNDGLDDDCNGLADDGDAGVLESTLRTFYRDADADGYGDLNQPTQLCSPSAIFVDNADDCKDNDTSINPDTIEICNGFDDDCDLLIDDEDDNVDPATFSDLFPDADGDGFGDASDPKAITRACAATPGVNTLDGTDCDDGNDQVNPGFDERLCDEIDNDCNAITPDDVDFDFDTYTACNNDCDDTNPFINPGQPEVVGDSIDQNCNNLDACYRDADGDGARTEDFVEVPDVGCLTNDTNIADASLPIDCDDNDPTVSITYDWYVDTDGDGFGGGAIIATECHDQPGLVSDEFGVDCNEADVAINPGVNEVCGDNIDQNCSGSDTCRSCLAWKDEMGVDISGVQSIQPASQAQIQDVYCDQVTDGGGWTLVASSTVPLNDGVTGYYDDLKTLFPVAQSIQVWRGMRRVTGLGGDIRFACKDNPANIPMTVDLSFYDTHWYNEITSGLDADSCFNEGNGSGADPAPERRNNISAALLPFGNAWNSAGYLEGEDACDSADDFTVDFDDRGMDGNQSDGTDWGEDDDSSKCGVSGLGSGSWFIFVRE